ncbi:MAG: acyltransferase family protein [Oceanospirillaceae bacterium]
MKFRKDLNGLRAIAVIAVVFFHFNAAWLPGGFAGVDVFFVISGFLMSGIIFRGLENNSFSITNFYVSRANRIVPALAVLCLVLLVLGWFYLAPMQYKALGKHAASSISFLSNIIYWREAGYFDTSSHAKWLLHTWSLSVEWQFYIIYPLVLVTMKRFMSYQVMKWVVLAGSVLGFAFCIVATYKWHNSSYYLLPTRAWEMMIGGVAYLFPFNLKEKNKVRLELVGIILLLFSLVFISKDNLWPGYLAIVPTFGAFLIIQSQRSNSVIANSFLLQRIGLWSYSIYLWHWPIVVLLYTLSINDYSYVFLGILFSVLLGFLSHKYIESKFKYRKEIKLSFFYTYKPLLMIYVLGGLSCIIFFYNGLSIRPSINANLISVTSMIKASPYRSLCHSEGADYRKSKDACTYFNENVTWATVGDSHSVELAYALAEKINENNEGIKHFSFSGCRPSYKKTEEFSKCAEWTNNSFQEIASNKKINNVLVNYRYSGHLFGSNEDNFPNLPNKNTEYQRTLTLESLDKLIFDLSAIKEQVFVFKPIPELGLSISHLLSKEHLFGNSIMNVKGVDVSYYNKRNSYIIKHFEKTTYPDNVTLIDPKAVFCDKKICYAIKNGIPLYFDDDHPSVEGAKLLINELMTVRDLKRSSFEVTQERLIGFQLTQF